MNTEVSQRARYQGRPAMGRGRGHGRMSNSADPITEEEELMVLRLRRAHSEGCDAVVKRKGDGTLKVYPIGKKELT